MRENLLRLVGLFSVLVYCDANVRSLNDGWTLVNEEKTYDLKDITVPSGVYSALEDANLTESVLFSHNDVKLRDISKQNWTYTLKFVVTDEELQHKFLILNFNGIDTLAEISLNNQFLGKSNNMFVRYKFDVKDILIAGENELNVKFESPVEAALKINEELEYEIPPNCPPPMYNGECHMNLLRKMQASFAWDWGLAAPSMGLWKSVDFEIYDSVVIRDVTYQMVDAGTVGDEEVWKLEVSVFLETGLKRSDFQGAIACRLVDVENASIIERLNFQSDDSGEYTTTLSLTVKKSAVKLWWPNGYGPQTLYKLSVQWEDVKINEVSTPDRDFYSATKSVKIGFRTVELIQDQMDNGLSFYFKINGVPIFMKGSNWIPAHILPEKTYNEKKLKELLQAARDAHMNMFRVWGGGVYESTTFFSLADEYGILIWQDLMFACAMYPAGQNFLDSVRAEIRTQIRRTQYHPSIAIYATNNENEVALRQNWYGTSSKFQTFAADYKKLYVDTVTDEIKKQDPTREVLTSSPSNGNYNGDREYGIGINPQDPHYGDIHFYIVDQNAWKPEKFHQPRFSSEYGFQSFPAGWSEVMAPEDKMDELVDHRQHHPLKSKPIKFLVEQNLNVDFDSLEWSDKIYLSQVSQAMAMKAETEVYRSGRDTFMNTMGALYWQLNDVWVAPSWSSIEYNGNFKILHHWIKQMFAPVTLVTEIDLLDEVKIYAISDEINTKPKNMKVKMNVYKWNDFKVIDNYEWKFEMISNAVTLANQFNLVWYLRQKMIDPVEVLAEFLLFGCDGQVVSKNFVFPTSLKNVKIAVDPKLSLKIGTNKCEKNSHRISLEILIESPAIFTSISLIHDKIQTYRVSKNGFIQFEPIQILQVTFENPGCSETVTVENFVAHTLNRFLIAN